MGQGHSGWFVFIRDLNLGPPECRADVSVIIRATWTCADNNGGGDRYLPGSVAGPNSAQTIASYRLLPSPFFFLSFYQRK
jgi:hypothetical protein